MVSVSLTMTSDGKQKPAKAERAVVPGRARRTLMPTLSLLERAHHERNCDLSVYARALRLEVLARRTVAK